jgi:hypothetical protein
MEYEGFSEMAKGEACSSHIPHQLVCIITTTISISQQSRLDMKSTLFMSFTIFMQLTSTVLCYPVSKNHEILHAREAESVLQPKRQVTKEEIMRARLMVKFEILFLEVHIDIKRLVSAIHIFMTEKVP